MDSEKEFFEFIKLHPELKSVAKSDFFASVLGFLQSKPSSFNSLREEFSFVPFSELKTIIESLEALELIRKSMNYGRETYSLAALGREFLEKYQKISPF
jgi:DNA-binding HxlR family transcriptional regulator